MYMYFCLHDTIEPVHLYIYILPNPYKIRSDQNLVTVDTPVSIAIAIAMTVGMTIGTIFVCPVRLDICQRPLDVEKHISLLRPDSRESSRCHFVISSLLLTSFNLQTGERGQTYLYHHHNATIPLN